MNKIDTIIIDFDSTILDGELLEMIAHIAFEWDSKKDKKIAQIEKITSLGMEGKISFSDSLCQRLALIPITSDVIDRCIKQARDRINKDFIDNFKIFSGKQVYVISGGYKNIIDALSEDINISKDRIFANEFLMNDNRVVGVDASNPLAQSDGKVRVAKQIRSKSKKIMIGDGMTDYYVKRDGGADIFVAYTAIAARESVIKKADFQIQSFSELTTISDF